MKFEMPVIECFDVDQLEEIMAANAGSCSYSCTYSCSYCSPVR